MTTLYYFKYICSSSCTIQYINILGPDTDISLFKLLQKTPFINYKTIDYDIGNHCDKRESINIDKFNQDLTDCIIYNDLGILYKGNYLIGFYNILRYINSMLSREHLSTIEQILNSINIVPLDTDLSLFENTDMRLIDLSSQKIENYLWFRTICHHYFSLLFIGRSINTDEIGY